MAERSQCRASQRAGMPDASVRRRGVGNPEACHPPSRSRRQPRQTRRAVRRAGPTAHAVGLRRNKNAIPKKRRARGCPCSVSRRNCRARARMAERRQFRASQKAGCPTRASGDGVWATPKRATTQAPQAGADAGTVATARPSACGQPRSVPPTKPEPTPTTPTTPSGSPRPSHGSRRWASTGTASALRVTSEGSSAARRAFDHVPSTVAKSTHDERRGIGVDGDGAGASGQ